MIQIENTPNLTGVTIRGDFHDMYNLVDAFHQLAIYEDSDKHQEYLSVSTRVLGLCYDIRHASMGDRDVELVDNNSSKEMMQWHSMIMPERNLYFSCNCLYPEMFFVMIGLNRLVELRIKDLTGSRYAEISAFHKKAIWDRPIATIRQLQAEFAECVRNTLAPGAFARWLTIMDGHVMIELLLDQYVDFLNIEYIDLTKKNREKKLSSFARRIAQFWDDPDYCEIRETVMDAAKEYNCHHEQIKLVDCEYPEVIEW